LVHIVSSVPNRQGKFLSMFSIVSFKNTICNGTSTQKYDNPNCAPQGICYSNGECDDKGGTDIGSCASGFGVCCQVTGTTANGETLSAFTNPDYPQKTKSKGNYKYEVSVDNENVCQLRFDICELKMADPTSDSTDAANNGKCEDESLEFTASGDLFMDTSLGITPLCGSSKYNSNQHLYVGDFKASGEKVVTIHAKTSTKGSKWFVKVHQIDCTETSGLSSNLRAPKGCRQFFTEDSGEINSFNFAGDGETKYWYPQNYKICIKRDPLNDCQIRMDRNPELSPFSVSIGLSADTTSILAPYGGCEYTDQDTNMKEFWGCGVPGKNEMTAFTMDKFTTDTGCGNDLVDQGGCFDPNPETTPYVFPTSDADCRRNRIAIEDYLNIQQGVFIRGCHHGDGSECAMSDATAHYITNDYYCGSGIGGDSPACSLPGMATLTDCAGSTTTAIGPDGKSGTPGEAVGLTSKTTGVFQQLGGSADDHFSAVFKVLDTSDEDGKAQEGKHRLGFGLIYEKSSSCTVFKNADKYVPNTRRRPLPQRPTLSPTPSVSIPALSQTVTNHDMMVDKQVPVEQSNTEVKETKFEATVYQTLLKILQGDFTNPNPMMGSTHQMSQDPLKGTTPRGKRTQSFRRNPFQNPPRYPTRKGY